MRTQDRTYLQTLGFQDEDKSNAAHDQATVYLLQKDKGEKLARMVFDKQIKEFEASSTGGGLVKEGDTLGMWDGTPHGWPEFYIDISDKVISPSVFSGAGFVSHAITKSHNWIVGYLDCLWSVRIHREYERQVQTNGPEEKLYKRYRAGIKRDYLTRELRPNLVGDKCSSEELLIAIEVKAHPVSVTRAIQQLNTYRQFLDAEFVLATLYPLAKIDKDILKSQGYWHVYLDPAVVAEFSKQANKIADMPF